MQLRLICLFIIFLIPALSVSAQTVATAIDDEMAGSMTRIKDIANVVGIRSNSLIGYGIIVGLGGSGDDVDFTKQSLRNMLERYGITADINDIEADNAAAVMVTCELPPFAVEGSRLDVLVNSVGDAESLQGGTLLMTELRGADGQVYALAQGPVTIGGFVVQAGGGGGGGQRVQQNHTTVGRIPNGAIVEYPVHTEFVNNNSITLQLLQSDFTTATNVQESINSYFGMERVAQAVDPGAIQVNLSPLLNTYSNPVSLVSEIERIKVASDVEARVIINERTGTVVAGNKVRISTVAISHGRLTIQVRSKTEVSQPPPFSPGVTVRDVDTELTVQEEGAPFGILRGEGATVEDLVNAFQALDGGLTPRDLIAIFEALKEAGALQAELVIM
jgi:flagellar P-ring protein FlgI